MIQYVFGQESAYLEFLQDHEFKEWNDDCDDWDAFMLTAEDQCWDKATLKQLRDEYDIIFDGSLHPVLVLGRNTDHPLLVIGSEDDGTIRFERRYGQFLNRFHPFWAPGLIANLTEAMRYSGYTKEAKP